MTKITDNSNELSFHQLTSTSSILLIPLFQRPYVWGARQLERMISEIEAICNDEDTSRFLGAIIAVTRPVNPAQPTPHEIVDGQQRLTTLYLFILAASQAAAREGRADYARGLISTYLIVEWAQDLTINTKLQPSFADRGQFAAIFDKVANAGELSDWLPVKLRLPSAERVKEGALFKQYGRILSYIMDSVARGGFEQLEKIVEAVRNGLTFVFILLKDPASATTVFEGLNDPGVPISVGDLVKNEVFSRVGYAENEARLLHDQEWVPLRKKFGDVFDDYFFPYCVIFKSGATKTEMFGELRKLWVGLDSRAIIKKLDEYSLSYLVLQGKITSDNYGKAVSKAIQRLVEAKIPSSTYPFLMRLLNAYTENKLDKENVIGCLEALESFLVRRAICGIEPTGLLGLFRTMWTLTEGRPTAKLISSVISRRMTIEWPNDDRLTTSVKMRPLYGTSIAKYVILEFERSHGREEVKYEQFNIEHVMPRALSESWSISKADHAKLKDLWANLVPLSKGMNSSLDRQAFLEKKEIMGRESMYASTRELAQKYESWGVQQIEDRSDLLAKWACARWKS